MYLLNIKRHLPLFIILCIGAIVFFVKLSTIPNGLYIDETLPGYSAYSILKTGKDEYGKPFPLVFRFYGSYNPPLFIYSVVLSEYIFGINEFAVRAPSALFGLISVIPIYFLIQELEIKNKRKVQILTSLLYVIAPWIVLHSRVGYEVSLGFLLLSIGVYYLYRSLSSVRYAPVAMFFLSASTYAAYAERFVVPLLLIGFSYQYRKVLFTRKNKNTLILSAFIGFLTQIPNLFLLTTPAFFPKDDLISQGIIIAQADKLSHFMPRQLAVILSFIREFLAQYTTYFSPESLFFKPDPDLQRSIPFLSVLYPWCIVPFISGIYWLYLNYKTKTAQFIILLLIVSPIPAALTKDPFSTHRALPHLLPILLTIACGFGLLISNFGRKVIAIILLCLLFSVFTLWRSYFVLLPFLRAPYWGYGYSQVSSFIKDHSDEHILFDESRQHPVYSQFLFYTMFDPSEFQSTIPNEARENYYQDPPFNSNFNFGNISIRSINWEVDVYTPQIIIGDSVAVSEAQAKEHSLTKVLEVKSPSDEVLFIGWRTDPSKKCKIEKTNVERCTSINTSK